MAEIHDIAVGGDIDPVIAALIIQLVRNGSLSGKCINTIARRSGNDGLRALFLEAMIDDSPDAVRSGLHSVPNGGNPPD